ncbi:MAG: hypothetical protein CO098_07390 [Bacteroidetes bacterium CG_4_9_14_3_um_filter_41_19]|nr:MAG: hypothetical protein CO098_07390 [Bacteroidetes bacterium CG_4_9_14_3_um_filter_41_19]
MSEAGKIIHKIKPLQHFDLYLKQVYYPFYREQPAICSKKRKAFSRLQKPSKIYLENTNLIYVFASDNANAGNIRETFFANQVGFQHEINYTEHGDFLVNSAFNFEIGGKHKSAKQLKAAKEGYVIADGIEFGRNNKIPLWLFGFMY